MIHGVSPRQDREFGERTQAPRATARSNPDGAASVFTGVRLPAALIAVLLRPTAGLEPSSGCARQRESRARAISMPSASRVSRTDQTSPSGQAVARR